MPTSVYIGRLTAVRMQFDIMGAETMLLMRIGLIKAASMTSVVDPRDHEYIIGATLPIEPLTHVLAKATEEGKTSLIKLVETRKAREETAGLMTFDEVKAKSTEEQYSAYGKLPTALAKRRIAVKEILGKDVTFDWELPRT